MAKHLLTERCEIGFSRNLPIEQKGKLEESLKISKKANDCLLVTNVVCTILDRKNENGRIYPTKIMERAIREAKQKMDAKMLVCSGSEHPQASSVEPALISHYISKAYIKNVELMVEGKLERHNVLFCDFVILPTDPHGKNFQKLVLEGVGTGISIRGLGDCDESGVVTEYEFLGADLVGLPSSSVYLSTQVNESVEAVPMSKDLKETFVVSASSTNVTRDLDQAAQLQAEIENKKYGTLAKTSMKVDSEVDPKTGAETTLVTLETETEDETSDLDQALMMAKRAILNGAADIDSVTIENIKEEEPKESAPVKDEKELKEEDHDNDEERYGTCSWCGDEMPLSDLKKEKDLGYICNHCAKGLESREGPLSWENEYVPESAMNEGVDKLKDAISALMYNEGLTLEQACRKFCEQHENIPYEYVLEYMRPTMTEACFLGSPSMQRLDGIIETLENVIAGKFGLSDEYKEQARAMLDDYRKRIANSNTCSKEFDDYSKEVEKEINAKFVEPAIAKIKYSHSALFGEAKEESPNTGKKFVLKCPAGFAAMDGNALVFKANPKEALHFVDGKEETGLVHLSEVEKILDAMGVYDREKYYRKGTTNISAKPAEEAVIQNGENKGVIKEGDNIGMDAPETAGTQFEAIIKIVGQNGESTDTIPVSATEYDSVIKEVGNLYDMKAQNADGELSITVREPATGKTYTYNPETRNLDPMQDEMLAPMPESAGDVEQNGNKLSMEIDDTDKIEKEFETPAQASVVKAGLEQGKLPGDVMLSEDGEKPDWKIGVVFNHLEYGEGPTSGQTVFNGEIPEKVRVYLYPEELGVTTIDDLMVTNEGIAKVEELAREKLSNKVDATGDIYTVREFKRDEYPEVPGIFDTEKELVEAERPQYQDAPDYGEQNLQPGWYAGASKVGITGPYESEEALRMTLGEYANDENVSIEYISPEDLGLATESSKIDEVLFKNPSEASDPEIKEPMTDAIEQDIMVTVDNIDWNTNDLINTYMNDFEADDVVSFGAIQSKINDLPDELDIKMTKTELPEDVTIETLKELVKNKIAKKYVMNVNDLDIKDLNSIN